MKIWNNSGIRKALIRIIGYLMILCMFGSIAVSEDVSPEVFYRDGITSLKYMTVESARNAAMSVNATVSDLRNKVALRQERVRSLESAVASDGDHLRTWVAQRSADGRRKSVAHCAQSA